ncbi:MAG: CRP-like cAMP-binding protein [Granulosicoccus sp.]|jgi:CRP-like cAMP-binding protein
MAETNKSMNDEFFNLINQYTSLTKEEVELVLNKIVKKTYPKHEVIFREGHISTTIYFVLKGHVRLFYNVDGVEKTAFFYSKGKFICAGESFTYNVPAVENYQAIEDTVLLHFDKAIFGELFKITPKFEIIGRIATENELITYQKMLATFITKSPEDRYLELMNTQPELFQKVPQQYIASFIGVSPETLSRIKKRVVLKLKNSKT